MSRKKLNTKMHQVDPEVSGISKLRVYHKEGKGKTDPRYFIKCGDCRSTLEIYYNDDLGSYLEINGVIGSIKEWEKILLPLLNIHDDGDEE